MENNGDELLKLIVSKIAEVVVKKTGESKDLPSMLFPRTIAKKLDCSVSEVRKHLQEHRIPTVRFGNRGDRVPREEFEKRVARWRAGGELWD